ncbi:MAG TPA: Calx-beta domain-containing protein [Solirubrobacteraceae bacterium]|nr:Calx-beta domain-containing protein [Solirubrobacteraceae bacterium]
MRSALLTIAVTLLAAPATVAAAPVPSVPPSVAVSEAAGAVTIPVTLSEAPAQPRSVSWRTVPAAKYIADGAACGPGEDFVEAAGTVVFAPGETQRALTVQVLDDEVDERGCDVVVELDEPAPLPGSHPHTWLSISDDDATPPASIADVRVGEAAGAVVVPVTRPAISRLGHARYLWRTRPLTATAPDDFTAQEGIVAIGYERDAAEVRIPIADDAIREPDERFEIVLEADPGPFDPFSLGFAGPVLDGLGTVTLADDEPGDPARTFASVARLRGRVRLDGRRLGPPAEVPPRGRIDARRGAARIAVTRDGTVLREAAVTGGAVRLIDLRTLRLITRALRIEATRGMRIRGGHATVRAAAPSARWTMAETARGTRVRVRSGGVRANGALLRSGATRLFG